MLLKQSNTTRYIPFWMIDAADHITGKTGLTPTVTLSKNNGAYAAATGTVSEIGNGKYVLLPSAADSGTLGILSLHATGAGADPHDSDHQIIAFDPEDAAALGLSRLASALALDSDMQTMLTRLSNTRAGYLDKLNITGNVAGSAEVTQIQNNTRTILVVPEVIERPDAGSDTYLVHLYLYDEVGNMEAPDSAPTLAIVNAAGTDRSTRLGSPTGTLVATGHYKWTYTNTSTDALEQLLWEFSVVEGGATRVFGRQTLIVDTSAVDFTSSDRTNLNAALAVLQHGTYGNSALQVMIDNLPTNTELATALASADDATLAAIATIMTTAMTESYAADGANATPAQILYEIRALLSEFSISGTTLTTKKKDGSTTAGTYTLNDAASPTSITRAS